MSTHRKTGRPPEPHGPAWLVQAAHIARLFYVEDRSKVEIADELGLSRFKVARILDDAREMGLVKVEVRLPALIDAEASMALLAHLDLDRAVVLDPSAAVAQNGAGADHTRTELGRLAARLLDEIVVDDDVLGLSCSRTVTATTRALTTLAACEVVQLTGTLAGVDQETGSVESVRRAAGVGGGRAWPVYAPMLLSDAGTVRSLSAQDGIRQSLGRIRDVTVAMVAVGAWCDGQSTVWSAASTAERAAAANAGAVGEIGGRLFDATGSPVAGPVDERVLGVTLEQLRACRDVILLAYGAGRADAVRAARRGGLTRSLVCDAPLAEALLAAEPVR